MLSIDIQPSIVDNGHISTAVLFARYLIVSAVPPEASDALLIITGVHHNGRISGAITEAIATAVLSWRPLKP